MERRVHHDGIGDGATEAGPDAFGFRRSDVGDDDGDVRSEASVCRADERLAAAGNRFRIALDQDDIGIRAAGGDCHAGNVLWIDSADAHGPHFVDFDDARMGPAVQDLWMLLSGERATMVRQLADLLVGYEDFNEFDARELHLVEALRTLRLIHYSAWIARRWDDPAFPAAFPWFNTQRYWQDRILELREQIALMDEPPLWPA